MKHTTAIPVQEKDKTVNFTLRERIEMFRSNRIYLLLFPFVTLALMIVVFGIATSGSFFRPSVLRGVFSQAVIIGTCSVGVAFIYSNGNLDISIGSVLGLAATIGVLAYGKTENTLVLVLVTMTVALALMAFNCTMSVIFRIKTIAVAIVVTQIYTALSTVLIGGAGRITVPFSVVDGLENGGFRYGAFIGYFLFCFVIYHITKTGRTLRFLGGNEICAQQTGMSNAKTTYVSFLMCGLGVGLAAVFSVMDVAAVGIDTGNGMGTNVMLATVLGGMSIFGGSRSNVYAGLIGALTVSALNKGLLMIGVSSALIQGIRGVIFLILVYLNSERPNLLPTRVQF